MNPDALVALADYLSGPVVAHSSIMLWIPPPPPHRAAAEAFFALRAAFGVRGYDTHSEALAAIRRTLNLDPRSTTPEEPQSDRRLHF